MRTVPTVADINRSQDLLLSLPFAHRHQVDDSIIPTEKLISLMIDLGLSAGAAQVAITRLTRAGVGRRTSVAGTRCMELTPYAEEIISGITERLRSFGTAPASHDRFTLVWHRIPNGSRAQRARLTQNLRLRGFGLFEDSTWLALKDERAAVATMIDHLDLTAYCSVLGGETGEWAHPRLLVTDVWDLRGLAERYDTFLERYAGQEGSGPRASGSLDPKDAFVTRIRLLEDFKVFPTLDPEVGDELGGLESRRHDAVQLFTHLYEELRSPAEEHFARS